MDGMHNVQARTDERGFRDVFLSVGYRSLSLPTDN